MHDVNTLRDLVYGFVSIGIALISWLAGIAVTVLKEIRKELMKQNVHNARIDEKIVILEKTTDEHGRRITHLERHTYKN